MSKLNKPKRVVIINSEDRVFLEAQVSSLDDMQKIVGGLIERAFILPNGDEIYVNEEGLLSQPTDFFSVRGAPEPFAGNAYVIGEVDDVGDNNGARSTLGDIKRLVRFMTVQDVQDMYL